METFADTSAFNAGVLKQSHYKLNGNKTRTVTITKNQENMKQPQFGMPDKKK
jgi:hypothetical protein